MNGIWLERLISVLFLRFGEIFLVLASIANTKNNFSLYCVYVVSLHIESTDSMINIAHKTAPELTKSQCK